MSKQKLLTGDRVAYAASFLKNTAQHTGGAPMRRGTFVKYYEGNDDFARVKWDDFEDHAPHYVTQYGQDYVDDAREHGQLVHHLSIARVGSSRFALTCAT